MIAGVLSFERRESSVWQFGFSPGLRSSRLKKLRTVNFSFSFDDLGYSKFLYLIFEVLGNKKIIR